MQNICTIINESVKSEFGSLNSALDAIIVGDRRSQWIDRSRVWRSNEMEPDCVCVFPSSSSSSPSVSASPVFCFCFFLTKFHLFVCAEIGNNKTKFYSARVRFD